MAVLVNTGSTLVASLLVDHLASFTPDRKFYIAWGSGDPAWDEAEELPLPLKTATGLVNLLGYIEAEHQYVTSDNVNGTIWTASGEGWTVSETPTPNIHLLAKFFFTDEPTAHIRELAAVVGAAPNSGSEDQKYLPIADIADLGTVLQIERMDTLERAVNRKGEFSMVIKMGD